MIKCFSINKLCSARPSDPLVANKKLLKTILNRLSRSAVRNVNVNEKIFYSRLDRILRKPTMFNYS